MNVFKKTCFECGAKVDILYENKCEDCFTTLNPPIEEVKPITLKVDNKSKEISYNSHFYPPEEIEKMLPNIMKKRVVINPLYTLNKVWIEDFKIKGSKVIFDVCVDCDLKD